MSWLRGATSQKHFERFTEEVTDSLVRSGYLMTWNLEETEDLVQETLFRVSQRWEKVRSMEHPAAYARRILVNLVIDGEERRTRRNGELSTVDPDRRTDDGATRALQSVDLVAELGWALGQLSSRQRAMVVLRYWQDLPEAEVAEIMGCSVGTVKSTTSRAVAHLRELLARDHRFDRTVGISTSEEGRTTSW